MCVIDTYTHLALEADSSSFSPVSSLDYTKIGDEECIQLAEALKSNSSLTKCR